MRATDTFRNGPARAAAVVLMALKNFPEAKPPEDDIASLRADMAAMRADFEQRLAVWKPTGQSIRSCRNPR